MSRPPPASAVSGDDGESPSPPARRGRRACPGDRRLVCLHSFLKAPQGSTQAASEEEEEQQEFEPKGLAMPTFGSQDAQAPSPRKMLAENIAQSIQSMSSPTTTAPPTFEMLFPASGDEPGGMDNLPTVLEADLPECPLSRRSPT